MATTIIESSELKTHLGDPNWILVDCRHAPIGGDPELGRTQYRQAHLPGAFYADLDSQMCSPPSGTNGRHPLPDPEKFAAYLRSIGVNDGSQIVAYDAGGDMFAARFWFLCRWIGHRNVAVLDGGFARWTTEHGPVVSDATPKPHIGMIAPHIDHRLVADADDVLATLADGSANVLDARAADRFAGENETIDPVAGHIPGAQNRFFKLNYRADGRFLAPDALRASFGTLGASPERIVHQCGSGVTASVNLLAMEYAGLVRSRIYAGSWSEWIADPSRPIERGPAGKSAD